MPGACPPPPSCCPWRRSPSWGCWPRWACWSTCCPPWPRRRAPPAALLRAAAGQAITRLPRTLLALVLAAALLAAQVLVLPYSLPLVLALGASLPAFAANFVRLEHGEDAGDP